MDEDDRIVKLLLLDELTSPVELSNPVVIMAGGKVLVCVHIPSIVQNLCRVVKPMLSFC